MSAEDSSVKGSSQQSSTSGPKVKGGGTLFSGRGPLILGGGLVNDTTPVYIALEGWHTKKTTIQVSVVITGSFESAKSSTLFRRVLAKWICTILSL